jgi:hypothetical protein
MCTAQVYPDASAWDFVFAGFETDANRWMRKLVKKSIFDLTIEDQLRTFEAHR